MTEGDIACAYALLLVERDQTASKGRVLTKQVKTKDIRPQGIVLPLVKLLYVSSSWPSRNAARHEGVDVGQFPKYPLQASILLN
jgi:hypothetical protein